ncbi:hydrolase [Rubrivivax gelatinosus]|uniref:Hydrolase n=1 Tax=Rubrivivax gelatinosus TaxID=28068 RepID=A0ABS1DW83_RUBGE|nr:HAD-IB family hydrolase [Rubrivivax gelatinosus]MBK1612337.1 hydrolase [Rubrivivax gelatinosus]MBK1713371.1 hydrolase [Rubrivivax gelatinosus]
MRLALFDLDHTLLPFDSGQAWTRFLVARGALPADAEAQYLAFCHQYVAGTLDIHAMHQAVVGPLAAFEPGQLQAWREAFAAEIAPRLPGAMRDIVDAHHAAGDLCAIVTATSRFVAEPFAAAFGVEHLVATEAQLGADGRPTGAIAGLPCFHEHKPARIAAWLASLGARTLADFGQSWFYSDSASDLPLLQAVTHPVAVRPDARLRAHAEAAGWPVFDTL